MGEGLGKSVAGSTGGRRLGCAPPAPKKAGPGCRRPRRSGDHEPQGPGEVGTLVLTLLW